MDIKKQTRAELKTYFVKNAIPTQENFHEFIDAMLNQPDDGIAKPVGDPLCIEASGDATSQKKAIALYNDFSDTRPDWVVGLNPRSNPAEPATARPGLGIGDGQGNNRLFIDKSTGRIGIGTNDPQDKMHLVGDLVMGLNAKNKKFIFHPRANANGDFLQITHDKADGNWDWGKGITLKRGGNVGIGTSAPLDKLDIYGALRFSGKPRRRIFGDSRAARETVVIKGHWDELEVKGRVIDWTGTNLHIGDDNDHSAHTLYIGKKLKSVQIQGTTSFYVGGKVGIGTTEPSHTFHVRTGDAVGLFESTGTHAYLRFCTKEGMGSRVEIANRPGGRLALWTAGSGDVLSITKTGNLGIGTPSPKAKLDVRGAIYAGNSDLYFTKTDHDHTGTGNTEGYAAIENAKNYDALMILGRAGTSVGRRVQIWDCLEVKGKFVNSSDLRAKKDIESVKYGLEAVKKLTPSSYNWKSTPNPHKSLGLIAQEVQPIIPEVVYKDEEGQMSIAYLDLIPVLINALKEIDGKIERLATPAPVRP